MKTLTKLGAIVAATAVTVTALTGAAYASTQTNTAARYATVNGGQRVALPPVVQRPVVTPREAAPVKTVNTGAGIPSGGYWQNRPESIFGRQSLILPAGTWLSAGQAAAALGVGSVQDSSWGSGGAAGGYQVTQSGGGWSAGSGGWAMIQAPTSGPINEILYVQWR